LTSVYIRDSDIPGAFQAIELSRAKLLTERLAGDESEIRLPEVKQIQETLDKDTVVLIYANVDWKNIVQIAITRKGVTGKEVFSEEFVQSSLDKYEKPIGDLLEYQRAITATREDKKEQLLSDKIVARSDIDNIVNYYRFLLKSPSSQYQRGVGGITKDSKGSQSGNTTEIGKGLYKLLIKPMEGQIKGKKNIIIVPDGILAFVPFETLIDEEGKYLAEDFHVNYVQSMGIREFVSERRYSEDRKPLLAFGGAVYDEVAYDVDMVENKTQLAFLTRNIYADLENKRSVRNAYGALGYGPWDNLPGTLSEVRNIKSVVKKADIFTGRNVTERNIKELSGNRILSKYKVLHFATHGLVVPEVPELSAVVLSQFENEQGREDGYLCMGEIAKLDIKADFVNLSACETGLGKIYGGEGVVGLTQSFLLAGANAVSVSLWEVSDESTSQFMVSMYDRVQDKDISYADAMTEVKRRFISGDFGDKYKSPYFWAPFVYYGKDDLKKKLK
jgi:CHAT domain-containing protein